MSLDQNPSGEAWGISWLRALGRDLRFSVRSLKRAKAFSFAVIATLTLCIWANTAVLSVLYSLVLKPRPIPDAGQVVDVFNSRPKAGQMEQQVSVNQYLDYKENADLFSGVSIWHGWMFNVGEETGPVRYVGMMVTSEYFDVVGLRPFMGRFFTDEECQPGKEFVAVLTQSFWETHYNADPDILGKEVSLTGRLYTVVGVMPKAYEELSIAPKLLRPFVVRPEHMNPQWRTAGMGAITARIKTGVAHGAALAQLQTLEHRFRDSVADPGVRDHLYRGGHRMGLKKLRDKQTEPVRKSLLMLQGGALLVLLLGCVNVASLMLARANTRQAEFAVRQSLGAGRLALSRQLFTEAAVLAVTGAALGLGLAVASLPVVNGYLAAIIFGIPPVKLDWDLVGLTLLVSFGVSLLIGFLPVLRIWRTGSLQRAIQGGTRGASTSVGIRAMSGILVVAQVALALILLVGAGLLIRSFSKVMAIDPGFDASQVIHARVAYDSSYRDMEMLKGLQNRILEKMREIPGVESVSISGRMPGYGDSRSENLPLKGMPPGQDGTYPTAAVFGVSPEYFETMGIRLLEGRNFTAADNLPDARWVFIVDRLFAERYFPDRSALGQEFGFIPRGQDPDAFPRIIGVVEVARVSGLENPNREPYVYNAIGTSRGGLSIEFRTKRTFEDMMPIIRAQLRAVDPILPIYQAQSMQTRLDEASANRRGVMLLLGIFSGVALVLAAVGIYGMLSYDVTQRTKEIGIRAAIGATREQIVALILKQGMMKTGLGMVIGLGGAFFLSRYLGSLLYEVDPRDLPVFAGVTFLILLVAFFASWLPARRAAKIDPMVALRSE